MSVDQATVRRIAHLARIAVADEEVPHLQQRAQRHARFRRGAERGRVEGVEPMTSVMPMKMAGARTKSRTGRAEDVVANAPAAEDDFFTVPKVVE